MQDDDSGLRTKKDKLEFMLFCKQATNNQLANIWKRERDAKRYVYAEIADNEMKRRGIN